MTEWQPTTIDQIASPDRYSVVGGPFGSALGRKDYLDHGVPVVRGAQLGGPGQFSHDDLVFVSEEKADAHQGNLAFPGDLVVTQRGTVGQVGRIPDPAPFPRYLLSQSQMKLTVNRAKADPRFVYYALLAPDAQQSLHGSTMSAGVPHINLATFRQLVLTLPTPATQSKVASVLGAIDDLIDNNRRRVELLEQMARAIYREWFVHFRYPGHEGVPLVDSALGPTPEGWVVRPLFSVADVAFGFSFKSKRFAREGPYPVIRIRDVLAGTTATFTDEEPPDRYLVRDGDVLIGMDGEFHLQQWSGGDAWLNQRVARLRPLGGMSARHLMLAVAAPIREWNSAISGTTVAHLGKAHMEKIMVAVPPPDLMAHASELLGTTGDQICVLLQCNRRLAALRDLLLPRLVSGKIDVSSLDLDALVERGAA